MRDLSCGDARIFLELEVRRLDCRNCGRVKRERLDFLADNPHYTKRFAYYVGRRRVLMAVEDNLGKGAAGQAIQNANLMSGFPEELGLDIGAVYP